LSLKLTYELRYTYFSVLAAILDVILKGYTPRLLQLRWIDSRTLNFWNRLLIYLWAAILHNLLGF